MKLIKVVLGLLILGLCARYAHGDTKIANLPVGAALTGTESIPMQQTGQCASTGATCQTTPAAITTYVNANASLPATAITSNTLNVARLPALTGGDCTTPSGSGVLTCTKTNGVSFGPAATISTTTGTGSVVLASAPTLTNSLTLGTVATPVTVTTPAGSASPGAALKISTGVGVGTHQPGGAIDIGPGVTSDNSATVGGALNLHGGRNTSAATAGNVQIDGLNTTLTSANGTTQFVLKQTGDYEATDSFADPVFFLTCTSPGAGQFCEFQVVNDTGDALTYGMLTSATTCNSFFGAGFSESCAFFDTTPSTNQVDVIFSDGGVPLYGYDHFLNYDVPAPTTPFATTDTDGFQYAQKVGGVPTGVPAHVSSAYASGVPWRYDSSNNRLDIYNSGWQQIQAGKLILSGVTGSIGGGALLAGTCTSGTVGITASTTAMSVVATPVTYPGDGTDWIGYVSSAGTITVKVCALVAVTPTATTYNVRVLQ